MPPVTKNLILINILIWLVEFCLPGFGRSLIGRLGLHYIGGENFNPAQILTYLFIHDQTSPMHVFFNMFSLWMFGRFLEQVWGTRRFLVYYFICGIGAALIQELVWGLLWHSEFINALRIPSGYTSGTMEQMVAQAEAAGDQHVLGLISQFKNALVTVGASGAIFGLLLGFAFVFPELPLYLFFIPVPIKAKYMVIGYAVLEFFLGVSGRQSTVAHFAHLGGLIFGLIPLLIWKKQGTLRGGKFN